MINNARFAEQDHYGEPRVTLEGDEFGGRTLDAVQQRQWLAKDHRLIVKELQGLVFAILGCLRDSIPLIQGR
jgi:hypothetical protein